MRPVLASPAVQGPPLTSSRGDLSPSPGQSVSLGLTHERLNASVTGLPSRMIDTIQNAKAASTHSEYDRKWNMFKCDETHTHTLFLFSALFSDVLCVQELVCRFFFFFVCRFSRGKHRLNKVSLIQLGDLSVILNALSLPPFESIVLI